MRLRDLIHVCLYIGLVNYDVKELNSSKAKAFDRNKIKGSHNCIILASWVSVKWPSNTKTVLTIHKNEKVYDTKNRHKKTYALSPPFSKSLTKTY